MRLWFVDAYIRCGTSRLARHDCCGLLGQVLFIVLWKEKCPFLRRLGGDFFRLIRDVAELNYWVGGTLFVHRVVSVFVAKPSGGLL